MKEKDIFMLERTKDASSSIIGFYNSEDRAIAALKRRVEDLIDERLQKAKSEGDGNLMGVYISEGFLITRNRVEVDPEVAFDKIEDAEEFPLAFDGDGKEIPQHHIAEDLGDVSDVGKGESIDDYDADFRHPIEKIGNLGEQD